ncbi:hypothetical protein EJB05_00707 [Eragrostis curvula]|uniref:mitogen-activated protein kinase kinase kinase n=1 Tax=Eragrostis curvula TaxID=38414 RepID=A0A5J9WME6_9POAL|nr:hypothetical protein EJB05_00706 [Eragrostis curvula]TVU49399.1 hypothetical protein EJB05_00707 [Eragrostis curvula]
MSELAGAGAAPAAVPGESGGEGGMAAGDNILGEAHADKFTTEKVEGAILVGRDSYALVKKEGTLTNIVMPNVSNLRKKSASREENELQLSQAFDALIDLRPPFQPQVWKKGELIGWGSYGQVYIGHNSENGRCCAIKEVSLFTGDKHSMDRLQQLKQEIDMLEQVSHPNIVQYYGSNLTDTTLSVYMEYVPKGSIYKLLYKEGPFDENRIRNCVAQILPGMVYLHQKNIGHRDIKGANILVGSNGEVKLADFGTAKHMQSFAEIHSIKGSAFWMAPEVFMSKLSKKGYTLAADIWSLGCTIIEMCTGLPPWHPLEQQEMLHKIICTNERPQIPYGLSDEGKDFLQLCLKREPASRPSAIKLMGHPFVKGHRMELW